MKKYSIFFFISLLMLSSNSLLSQEMKSTKIVAGEACVKSLLNGLNSDNEGLQAGCLYMFGELCSDNGVIPLLKILHNDSREEMRILAALSLYKIGDSRGIFAVKRAIRFDDSERVRKMCARIYHIFQLSKTELSSPNIAAKF